MKRFFTQVTNQFLGKPVHDDERYLQFTEEEEDMAEIVDISRETVEEMNYSFEKFVLSDYTILSGILKNMGKWRDNLKKLPVESIPYATGFSPTGFFPADQVLTADTQGFFRFHNCCSKLQVYLFEKGTKWFLMPHRKLRMF